MDTVALPISKIICANMPEDHLVASIQLGDLNAFERLVRQYQNMVYAVAFQVLGNADDAHDVCQECFLKVHREIRNYRPSGKFSTWLYRVAMNTAIDFQRKQKRERYVSLDKITLTTGKMDSDLRLTLNHLLTDLPPKQRAAFVLRDLQGFPLNEVAEILKCNPITIRVHLLNARRYIRKKLEPFL